MKYLTVVVLLLGILFCNANPTSQAEKSAFKEAVLNGNVEGLRELLKDKDVNKACGNGRNGFHFAAEHGNKEVVDFFLEKGADVNFADDEGFTPVHYAALNPNEKILEILLKHGGDVNKLAKKGETPCFVAAFNPNEKVLELLINNGANVTIPNIKGRSPLLNAASNGNDKVIDLFLKQNVDLNHADENNLQVLHVAVANSNPKVVEKLIKAGANVNAETIKKTTPIFYAVGNGNQKVAKLIKIQEGDDYIERKLVEVIRNHFDHPIEENAGEKIVELLVNNGADINWKNAENITAYDGIIVSGGFKMAEFLVKHGATENTGLKNHMLSKA